MSGSREKSFAIVYCCTYRELDQDMQEIKELNSEIFSVAKSKNSGDNKRSDLVQLSVKTNRLLKKILLRRFQLEQEAKYIKTMSNKVANREDGDDDGATVDPRENGIDKVISKLKTMIHDLDSTEDKPGGVSVFFCLFSFVCVCYFISSRILDSRVLPVAQYQGREEPRRTMEHAQSRPQSLVTILGSLSKGFYERWTSTRSEPFLFSYALTVPNLHC